MAADEVTIPSINPDDLQTAIGHFGSIVSRSPELSNLVNAMGPALFAGLLFMTCEDYTVEIENGVEILVPRRDIEEASNHAIGFVHGVRVAMSMEGVVPTDSEIDASVDIVPVSDTVVGS